MEGSRYYASPKLYKENGFKAKEDAQALIDQLSGEAVIPATLIWSDIFWYTAAG